MRLQCKDWHVHVELWHCPYGARSPELYNAAAFSLQGSQNKVCPKVLPIR